MIKWEKNYKGQPAFIKDPDLDNISEADEERAEGHQRFCAPDFLEELKSDVSPHCLPPPHSVQRASRGVSSIDR